MPTPPTVIPATAHASVQNYSIRDIVDYRSLPWRASEEFLFLTEIPVEFEPFFVRSTYYCFGMITEGRLDIDINHHNYFLAPASLMVYRPGQVFKVQAIAEGTRGVFVLFTRKFLDYLDENIFSVRAHSFLSSSQQSLITLDKTECQYLLRLFHEIFALLRHLSPHDWEAIARNLASALIYETDTILKTHLLPLPVGAAGRSQLFDKFRQIVGAHAHEHRSLSFYAAALCVSPGHLHAVVKKASGKSPTYFINHQVIKQAKHLLSTTPANVGEVAYRLHFSDPFAFSKFFKKHTGWAPSQYRQQMVPMPADSDMECFIPDMVGPGGAG